MAKGNSSSAGRGLNLKAKLDIAEAFRDARKLKNELKGLGVALNNSASSGASSNFIAAQGRMTKAIRDSLLETQRLTQEGIRLRNEYEQGRISAQTLAAAERVVREQRRALAEATRQARREQVAANGSYQEAQARLRQLGNQIRSVQGGFASLGPVQQARIKEYNKLNEELKKFDAQMGIHGRKVGDYAGAVKRVANDLAGMATSYLSAGAALEYVLKSTREFERIKTPLTYILGSEGDANVKLKELKVLANDLGLEFFTLASSYKSFAAAAMASNFPMKDAEKIFLSVSKAAAVLKISDEQLQGSLLALQQMISKGNVQAEELRGQLSERLPGAFALAAKAMGVTEKELNKLLQNGEVLASELLPKLAEQLDKRYGDKASEGIKGLNAEIGGLMTSLQSLAGEGSALSENLFQPIVRGARLAVAELGKLFRGSAWENLQYLLTFSNSALKNKDRAYDLRDSLKNSQSQLSASMDREYIGMDLKELRNYYSQLQKNVEDADKSYRDFANGIKSGDLKEEFKGQLESYRSLRDNLANERKMVGTAIDRQKRDTIKGNKEVSDLELKSIAEIRKRITELQKLPGSADIGSEIQKRIEALQARLKKPADTTKSDESAVQSRNDMQARIDALTKKGVDKQKSADEQELESVRKKYADMRREAEKFNNNSSNKKRGLRVDAGGLLQAQSTEEDAVRDKQAADKLKVTLDKQKKLYDDYEAYVGKVGSEKAKERYASQLDAELTYLEKLQQQRESLLNPQKSKGADNYVDQNAIKLQLKELDEAIAAEKLAVQKKQDDLLASLMDFDAQRRKIESDYNSDKAALGDKASVTDLAQLDKRKKEELEKLGDAHLQELEAFNLLYAGIDRLSDKNALKIVGNAENALKALKAKGVVISKELEAELKRLFSETRTAIADRLPENLINIANQIDGIASAVGDVDGAFGKMLSTVSNVVGQVGNIKKGLGEFKSAGAKGDVLGQLGGGLGILGAGISVFKSVFSLFDRSQQREEQASYARDLQNKQTEALNKALERQISLLDEVYGTQRVKDYDTAIQQATENQAKYVSELTGRYALTGNKLVDDLLAKINNGEKPSAMSNSKAYSELIKLRDSGQLKSFEGMNINQLQTLLDEGKLDASTATIVQNLIQANQAATDLTNKLRQEVTGTSIDQLADSFISTLTDGVQDFGATFEETIQKSIINGFKGEIIKDQLQQFYTTFAEYSKDGLTSDEINSLRIQYLAASEKAKADLDALSKATGIDLTGGADKPDGALKPNTLTASLNQPTAERLEGLWRGQFDLTKQLVASSQNNGLTMGQMHKIAMDNLNVAVKIEANTFRTANNTDGIAGKLDEIIKNTKGTKSGRD